MKTFDSKVDEIAILGLGYVGIPLSLLLARNYRVIGFDTDISKVFRLKKWDNPITEPGIDELLDSQHIRANIEFSEKRERLFNAKVKIITVGTPYDGSTDYIDYSQLESALSLLQGMLKEGDMIILKSTVPPGTTNGIVRKKIEEYGFKVPEQVGIAFSPERMVEGQAIHDFQALPKIIGASDDDTSSIVSEIIGSLGGEIVRVSSTETAEMVKMVDNYSRFVFLGLTNEIALISEKIGVDVLELISAAKHSYPRNAGLLLPGPGVGGSCLNKDPFILRAHLRKNSLNLRMVESANAVNSGMPEHVSSIVDEFAAGRKRIVIAGVSFKGDTDDTRFTPSYLIEQHLVRDGYDVVLSDPFVRVDNEKIVKDLYQAAEGQELMVLLTDHSEYKNIQLELLRKVMAPRPLIVDTRGLISRKEAIDAGFEYHGLGRL